MKDHLIKKHAGAIIHIGARQNYYGCEILIAAIGSVHFLNLLQAIKLMRLKAFLTFKIFY